jgi:hypothetical protein
MKQLTAKEERFCTLLIMEGMTQRKAYRLAYNSQGNDQAVDVSASRLVKKPKIASRLHELRTLAVSPAVLDRQERMETLSFIARDTTHKTTDRLKAIELLSRANGDYIQRIETISESKVDLSMYTTEDLKLMLEYMRDERRKELECQSSDNAVCITD